MMPPLFTVEGIVLGTLKGGVASGARRGLAHKFAVS